MSRDFLFSRLLLVVARRLFVCIFIGNLISLSSFCLISTSAFVVRVLLMARAAVAGEGGSKRRSEHRGGRREKFIKYNFERAPRKKEINFHKFESQIKLRRKSKVQVVCCLPAKPYTCLPLPPRHLTALASALFSLAVACVFRLQRHRRAKRMKRSCIFEAKAKLEMGIK
jgi:hypothetical protein